MKTKLKSKNRAARSCAASPGSGAWLLPPAPDKCQACAVKHPPEHPHNQQSLHWQYWFWGQHQRWPTWADAMAHCTPEMQAFWLKELAKHKIVVKLPNDKALAQPGRKETL